MCTKHLPPIHRFICLICYLWWARLAAHTYIHTYIHTYAAAPAVIRLYVKRVFKPSTFLTYLSKIAAALAFVLTRLRTLYSISVFEPRYAFPTECSLLALIGGPIAFAGAKVLLFFDICKFFLENNRFFVWTHIFVWKCEAWKCPESSEHFLFHHTLRHVVSLIFSIRLVARQRLSTMLMDEPLTDWPLRARSA